MKTRPLETVFDVHRLVHAFGLAIDRLPYIRVTQAEAFILAYLSTARGGTIAELHRVFGHRRSTLTDVVDRLVGRGLASRQTSPQDRRSLVVRLSKDGVALARKIQTALANVESAAFKGAPKSDVDAFRRVVARLEKASREAAG